MELEFVVIFPYGKFFKTSSTHFVKINTDIDLSSSSFSGISIGIKVFTSKA